MSTIHDLYNYLTFNRSDNFDTAYTIIESVFGVENDVLRSYNTRLLSIVDLVSGLYMPVCYLNSQEDTLSVQAVYDRIFLYRNLFDTMQNIGAKFKRLLDLIYANNYTVLYYKGDQLPSNNLHFAPIRQAVNLHYIVSKTDNSYTIESNSQYLFFYLLTKSLLRTFNVDVREKLHIYLFGLFNSGFLRNMSNVSLNDILVNNYVRDDFGFVLPYTLKIDDENILFVNNKIQIDASQYVYSDFTNNYNNIQQKYLKTLGVPLTNLNIALRTLDTINLNSDTRNIQSYVATVSYHGVVYPRGMHIDTYDSVFENRNSLLAGNIVVKTSSLNPSFKAIKIDNLSEFNVRQNFFSICFYENSDIPYQKAYNNYITELTYDFSRFKSTLVASDESIANLHTVAISQGNKVLTGFWKYTYVGTKQGKHFVVPFSLLSYTIYEQPDYIDQRVVSLYEFDVCPLVSYTVVDEQLPLFEEIKETDFSMLLIRVAPGVYQIKTDDISTNTDRYTIACGITQGLVKVFDNKVLYIATIDALLDGFVDFRVRDRFSQKEYRLRFKLNLITPFTPEYYLSESETGIDEIFVLPAITVDQLNPTEQLFLNINYKNTTTNINRITSGIDASGQYLVCTLDDSAISCVRNDLALAMACSRDAGSPVDERYPSFCLGSLSTQNFDRDLTASNLVLDIMSSVRSLQLTTLIPWADTELRELQIKHGTHYYPIVS